MKKCLSVMALLMLLVGPRLVATASSQSLAAASTPTFQQQTPVPLSPPSSPHSSLAPSQTTSPSSQLPPTVIPRAEGETTGKRPDGGTIAGSEPLLSDGDRARLLEYRQMPDDEKSKVSDFCTMSGAERTILEKYAGMAEGEKLTDPEFTRLSDEDKRRIMAYARLSEIEKARFSRYCAVVDVEKSRLSLGDDVSEIEKAMSDIRPDDELFRPQPLKLKRLEQFGYNFFRPDSPGFSSLSDVPVGDDYLVGPGDRIVLQLWGGVEGVHELEVNRSGEVLLPKVGTVRVWGVPFGELQELFRKNLSRIFKDFQLNVNMGKLRLMKIYIVGEVKAPGDYNLGSLSTVINALGAAGGPTKNGSLRTIQIHRAGKMTQVVDLYNFFLKGDKSCDVRLQPGDSIYVPVVRKVAAIGGNVRRPAIYELKDEKSLTDLLTLADGISVTGSLQRVQIEGIRAHDKKQVRDFNLDPRLGGKSFREKTDAIPIRHMDSVRVFSINTVLRGQVRIEGYALHPGDYALRKGMRVKDLFGESDILPETYRDVAVITRMLPPDYRQEKMSIDLGQALAGVAEHNLELKEFDRVKLFSRWEMEEVPMVRISGEVQKPGSYRLYDKMSLRDLIYGAGNLKMTAYLRNAEITRVVVGKDGVRSSIINVDLEEVLKGNPADNILLENLDEVVVRRVPEWKEETERYFTLRGEVRFPGVYPILPGEKLSSLIQRAGGYTERAYLKGAKFSRKLTRELQQKRMNEVLNRAELDLARKQEELSSLAASKEELEATRSAIEGMKASIQKLRLAKAEGRISLQLTPLPELRKSPNDLVLQGGDTLEIPQSTNSVVILGEVYSPTTVVHLPGKRLGHYLNMAGGATQNADEDEMYVLRADGTVTSCKQHNNFFTSSGFLALKLDPNDTIVVPQKMERIAWMRELKDIATIIGQIALTAGVVIAAM